MFLRGSYDLDLTYRLGILMRGWDDIRQVYEVLCN